MNKKSTDLSPVCTEWCIILTRVTHGVIIIHKIFISAMFFFLSSECSGRVSRLLIIWLIYTPLEKYSKKYMYKVVSFYQLNFTIGNHFCSFFCTLLSSEIIIFIVVACHTKRRFGWSPGFFCHDIEKDLKVIQIAWQGSKLRKKNYLPIGNVTKFFYCSDPISTCPTRKLRLFSIHSG